MSLNITVCVCVIRGKKENVLSDIMKKKKKPNSDRVSRNSD